MKTEPYRPSNGTEGDMFMDAFCHNCKRDSAHRRDPENGKGCRIIVYMMAFHIGDKEYPRQIVQTAGVPWPEKNPRCTAYRPPGSPPSYHRKQKPVETTPLFGEKR